MVFRVGEPFCGDIWAHYRKAMDHQASMNALDKRRRLRATCGQPPETP